MKEAERIRGYLDELQSKSRAIQERVSYLRARGTILPDVSRIDTMFLRDFLNEASVLNDKLADFFAHKEKARRTR